MLTLKINPGCCQCLRNKKRFVFYLKKLAQRTTRWDICLYMEFLEKIAFPKCLSQLFGLLLMNITNINLYVLFWLPTIRLVLQTKYICLCFMLDFIKSTFFLSALSQVWRSGITSVAAGNTGHCRESLRFRELSANIYDSGKYMWSNVSWLN